MLKQYLSHKLSQKLSPQQIQLMKLLQVPTVELEQRIKDEIEENPALEEGIQKEEDEFGEEQYEEDLTDSRDDFDVSDYLDSESHYSTKSNNYADPEKETNIPISGGKTFQERLTSQISLRLREERKLTIAQNIIGNLDESGYLRRELINIMAEEDEIEEVLYQVQDLDPAGVGARDLKECLLIQLDRKQMLHEEEPGVLADAINLIEHQFEAFTKKHYSKILERLSFTEERLKATIEVVTKLNPKPAGSIKESSVPAQHIIPDYILTEDDGELNLTLNSRNAPQLNVSRTYHNMLQTYDKSKKTKQDKEAVMFIKQKLDAASWFIDAIKQRQHTMMSTMETILKYQREYFLSGDETKLRPMILKDIADVVELDISTVSRVTNSKYIQTPFGTFLLKSFFSESLSTDSGEDVSTREVKKILQNIVEDENKKKPLTDGVLTELLKDKGYNIARRTIAKYREQLGIPVARLRKEL
jgi:RNA polymerase sigma-54 factor